MSRNSAFILAVCVAGLVCLGIVMLYSTSAYVHDQHNDAYYYIKRQSIYLGIGVVGCVVATFINYHFWAKIWLPMFGVSCVLLVLCFVPHIGMKINGSPRWIHLGPAVFQPSELAKFAALVALAWWFTKHEAKSSTFLHGFVLPMLLVALPMVLILKENDLGTTLLICATSVAMMFIAGSHPIYMGSMAVAGAGGILFLAMHMSERMARLTAFLDLEKYKDRAGLQQWESLKAFGSGGLLGLGLGESREKMLYLPYAHTDFIFPIIGEELGLRATLLVVCAFLALTMSGIVIALQARDRFGTLLAFGLVMNIGLQACVNIGMTTALLPNKGMPLPFISYGGSNLCLCLLFTGVLLNIYRRGQLAETSPVTQATGLQARVTPRI